MRIKIEIEDDQVSVKTDDAERIDEDQEAEKSWFRDAIGHKWVVLKGYEKLSGEGWFVYVRRRGDVYSVKDPNGLVVKGYYKLPPLGELESSE